MASYVYTVCALSVQLRVIFSIKIIFLQESDIEPSPLIRRVGM